jgi:Arc/MetJ family transcription regulator
MRTNIDIDEELLKGAMKATGLRTKKAVVERGLSQLVGEARRRLAIKNLQGIGWEGDLEDMRLGHPSLDEK